MSPPASRGHSRPALPSIVASVLVACTFVLFRAWDSVRAPDVPGAVRPGSWNPWFRSSWYSAICVVVKDQESDIREWVEWHEWIGFRKIYVYDNNSTQDMRAAVHDYILQGLVEYAPVVTSKSHVSPHSLAYRTCISRHRWKHRWLAFIDVDEFLLIRDKDPHKQDINSFLKDYEQHGGLVIHSLTFGSSGHLVRPQASTLTSYTSCSRTRHDRIKTIANTRYLVGSGPTPYVFLYRPHHPAVNEAYNPVVPHYNHYTSKRIVLLHYILKSKEEFSEKLQRRGGAWRRRPWQFFQAVDRSATQNCTLALSKGRQFEACCFDGPGAKRPRGSDGTDQLAQHLRAGTANSLTVQLPMDLV